MNLDIARDAAHWLNNLKHGLCQNAVPVAVTVTYDHKHQWKFWGAKYDAVHLCLATERYVTDGLNKVGDQIREPAFYLVSGLPAKLLAKNRDGGFKYDYRFPDDDGDWFIAGFSNRFYVNPEHAPFGAFFTLKRWNHELPWMGRIDQYAASANKRLPATFELLPTDSRWV